MANESRYASERAVRKDLRDDVVMATVPTENVVESSVIDSGSCFCVSRIKLGLRGRSSVESRANPNLSNQPVEKRPNRGRAGRPGAMACLRVSEPCSEP